VVSIQHELAGDPPLAQTGNLYERRKRVWDNGVKNIRFVIQRLHALRSDLDLKKVMLIGHSNGGDMIMLFATQYPHSVSALIDLDRSGCVISNVCKSVSKNYIMAEMWRTALKRLNK